MRKLMIEMYIAKKQNGQLRDYFNDTKEGVIILRTNPNSNRYAETDNQIEILLLNEAFKGIFNIELVEETFNQQ